MNIVPSTFMHPEDRAALETLRAIPVFPSAVKGFMKIFNERFFHGISMAQKIRLGPKQLPDIYDYLPPICETLGIDEPELYLEMNPAPNAYAFGENRIFITLTSGLVEYLDEDELQAVIAHECGHILFHHTLYRTMTIMLLQYGSEFMGSFAALSKPLELALLYWFRRSELSADRAAAVALKDSRPMIETMVRLAGGPKSITEKINLDLFIHQADIYDSLLEDKWDRILQSVAVMNMDHPFAAVRTREISRWADSEEFQQIVKIVHAPRIKVACPNCAKPLQIGWMYCGYCGFDVATLTMPPVSGEHA